MKLAFLAIWGGSVHGVRWVNAMAERGHDVHLITMHPQGEPLHPSVKIHRLPFPHPFGYYLNAIQARVLLSKIKPDLIHMHRGSGYGTLGRLCGYHPSLLSVWGADVYDFPFESDSKHKLIVKNLLAADWVCSTSHTMAEQTRSLCPEIPHISVTPFGIDIDLFKPIPGVRDTSTITVGTVKTLAPRYGIDTLVRGFAHARQQLCTTSPETAERLRLLIAGGGPQRQEIEDLVQTLGLSEVTEFTGLVRHDQVPQILNRLDIYVAASRSDSESFGVAVLEASACCLPVIVTNVGGLPEVVEPQITGLIVPKDDTEALSEAIRNLVQSSEVRQSMGEAGRQSVTAKYQWSQSVSLMEDVYSQVMALK